MPRSMPNTHPLCTRSTKYILHQITMCVKSAHPNNVNIWIFSPRKLTTSINRMSRPSRTTYTRVSTLHLTMSYHLPKYVYMICRQRHTQDKAIIYGSFPSKCGERGVTFRPGLVLRPKRVNTICGDLYGQQ